MTNPHPPPHGRKAPTAPAVSNLPFLIAIVLVLVSAGALGWWLLAGSNAPPTTATSVTLPTDGSIQIAPTSELLISDVSGQPPQPGTPAPDFRFTLADDSTVQLSDLQGKKVLLNFWATWCGPCKAEMPDMQALQVSYPDDLVVLAVNQRETVDRIVPFAEELGLTFTLVADEDGTIGDAYAARGLPTSYFINRDGTVHAMHAGLLPRDMMEQRVQEMQ